MNAKILAGFVLAFSIGVICRLAGLPLPAPPVFIGALLVVAMTCGFVTVDRLQPQRADAQRRHCAGPTGGPAEGGA